MKNAMLLLVTCLLVLPVFAQPAIQSFSPGSGPVGTTVTINGTGFSTTPANNIVYFGAVQATVEAATETALQVAVPVGASHKPISVTTGNLTTSARYPFTVTFSAANEPFRSTSFQPKTDILAGNYPHSAVLADFNQDGKADLLVSRGSSNRVSVIRNTSAGGSLAFAAIQDFAATGFDHEGTAIGDLDGDGKLDFVLTNSIGLHSVSVFRNTSTAAGAISFATRQDLPADNAPYTVAVDDLDGDGKPDLVVGNGGSNKVTIYKNTSTPGNISFSAKRDFEAGAAIYGVATADLDGDGKPELVLTSQGGSPGIFIMRNTSGTEIAFEGAVSYAVGAGFFTIATGDLDGDGKPEVAAAKAFSNDVLVLRNNSTPGDLSLAQQYFSTGNYPVSVAMADLNGDGKPDLVTANRMGNSVSALRNTSTGATLSFDAPVHYAVGAAPLDVTVGDLNGDGRPDVLASNSSAATVSILVNQVGANVAPEITAFTPASGTNSTTVSISGVNFTGATEVTFGGVAAASFTVNSPTLITAVVGGGASGDVRVTTAYGTAIRAGFYYMGPIIHAFTPVSGSTGTVVTITGVNFTGATAVSFGGIAAASFTVTSPTTITATVGAGASGSVSVTTENGTATLPGFSFGAPTISAIAPASGPVGTAVTISGANFSPNASENIVFFGAVKARVQSASATQLQVIVPAGATYQPVSVTVNNLTGYSSQPFMLTFPAGNTTLTASSFSLAGSYGVGAYPFAVGIADFNDDGKPDLLAVNGAGSSVSVLKNNSGTGAIAFGSKLDISTGPSPRRFAIGDLDGDGKPDIVVTNFNSGNASTISVVRNTSSGGTVAFAPAVNYSSGNGSVGVAIADMNLDGKPDVIVTSGNSGIISIFRNTTAAPGAISFAAKQDFTLLTHPNNIVVADLNGDGKPDLATSNFSNQSISVFRNISTVGSISLSSRIDYSVHAHPSYITAGDLNGDTKPDIIVTSSSTEFITIYQNNSTSNSISLSAKKEYALANAGDIALADLNGDGLLDMFTGRRLSGHSSLIQNTYPGSGSFAFAANVDFATGTYDTFVAAGDLDGDGKPELVVANTTQNNVSVLKNNVPATAPTGIANLGKNEYFRFYPNPVKDKLYLDWHIDNTSLLHIDVTDVQGSQVLINRNLRSGMEIDLSSLSQGLYVVKVYSNDKMISTMKIIKM